MEKLLHERLREYDEDTGRFKCSDGFEADISWKAARHLADEIERYYIPRPRFEDGEPVQFGEEVKGCNGNVKALLLFKDGSGQAYGAMDDPWEPSEGASFGCDDLKRPTPKVYDADGVEIKRNDRMYPIEKKCNSDTEGYIVNHIEVDDGINSPRVYFIDDVGMSWMKADQLTHERPVFDAEGVRICKGDMVWDKVGTKLTVTMPYPYGRVYCEDENGIPHENHPSDLTHHEPDSLEKLRDDIIKNAPNSPALFTIKSWADRLTALIERGA